MKKKVEEICYNCYFYYMGNRWGGYCRTDKGRILKGVGSEMSCRKFKLREYLVGVESRFELLIL